MNCPNCGVSCGESDRFCYCCGTELPEDLPAKKGSLLVPAWILVALSILGCVLYFATSAVQPSINAEEPWFTLRNGTLSFDATLYTGGETLTVPESIGGNAVEYLADGCFADCDMLTTVILPNSLLEVGARAFAGCDCLRGIFIPESVTEIGASAFAGCPALEAVCVPASVASIGKGAFTDCTNLYYIFFTGSYETWVNLYTEFVTPYTVVYCANGTIRQGGSLS